MREVPHGRLSSSGRASVRPRAPSCWASHTQTGCGKPTRFTDYNKNSSFQSPKGMFDFVTFSEFPTRREGTRREGQDRGQLALTSAQHWCCREFPHHLRLQPEPTGRPPAIWRKKRIIPNINVNIIYNSRNSLLSAYWFMDLVLGVWYVLSHLIFRIT